MRAEYETLRGMPHRPPPNEALFVGAMPPQYLPYVEASLELDRARRACELDAHSGFES